MIETGVPWRRIWLELRKLQAAEQRDPGVWPRSLLLAHHLGVLPHLLPWLAAANCTAPLAAAPAQQQAVRVASRLCAWWRAQPDLGGGAPPLPLLVAATVHPTVADLGFAREQVCAVHVLHMPRLAAMSAASGTASVFVVGHKT
jgi:hypothetical protein